MWSSNLRDFSGSRRPVYFRKMAPFELGFQLSQSCFQWGSSRKSEVNWAHPSSPDPEWIPWEYASSHLRDVASCAFIGALRVPHHTLALLHRKKGQQLCPRITIATIPRKQRSRLSMFQKVWRSYRRIWSSYKGEKPFAIKFILTEIKIPQEEPLLPHLLGCNRSFLSPEIQWRVLDPDFGTLQIGDIIVSFFTEARIHPSRVRSARCHFDIIPIECGNLANFTVQVCHFDIVTTR